MGLLQHLSIQCYKKLIQHIMIHYELSCLEYFPFESMRFCIQSCHPRKHLVKSFSLSLLSSFITEAFIFHGDKNESFSSQLLVSEKAKSHKAPSLEIRRVVKRCYCFWAKSLFTLIAFYVMVEKP